MMLLALGPLLRKSHFLFGAFSSVSFQTSKKLSFSNTKTVFVFISGIRRIYGGTVKWNIFYKNTPFSSHKNKALPLFYSPRGL